MARLVSSQPGRGNKKKTLRRTKSKTSDAFSIWIAIFGSNRYCYRNGIANPIRIYHFDNDRFFMLCP
jgi:hypothetical protein